MKAFALLTCENSVTRKCKRWWMRGLLGVALVPGLFLEWGWRDQSAWRVDELSLCHRRRPESGLGLLEVPSLPLWNPAPFPVSLKPFHPCGDCCSWKPRPRPRPKVTHTLLRM